MELNRDIASGIADIAPGLVAGEYPHKLDHVAGDYAGEHRLASLALAVANFALREK